jgi:DivIVA domain-containing protein
MPDTSDDTPYPNLVSIETKTFRLGLKGYMVREVDAFLEALVVEFGALKSELEDARLEIASLRAQLS